VWAVEVWDQAKVLIDDDVSERTAGTVSAAAAQHGATFMWCADDDEVDEVPYYRWYIRVPQDEHRKRTAHDVPVAIESVHRALEAALPGPLTTGQFIRAKTSVSTKNSAPIFATPTPTCWTWLMLGCFPSDATELKRWIRRRSGTGIGSATEVWSRTTQFGYVDRKHQLPGYF
jgi:hypothetical protein